MLRVLFSIGPVGLLVAVITVWAQASDLPATQRVAAEICRDPGISTERLAALVAPGPGATSWTRLSDERPVPWLHRRFLASPGNAYWIIAKSRLDADGLARVWIDIGGVDDRATPVTRAAASFDGACRLLEAESF